MKKFSAEDLSRLGSDSRLVVGGRDPQHYHGFVNPPPFRGSTVLASDFEAFLKPQADGYTYGRRGNPTSRALEEAMRGMDGSAGVVLCPSGLSAVSTALLSCLKTGDHLLMVDTTYGPARQFCDQDLTRFGIEVTYYDPMIGEGIAALIRPNTAAVYLESPGSLTMEVQDIPTIAQIAHRHGATVLIDNTWATPLLLDAFALGADISLLAGSKYIVGHSDAMFGIVSANERAWPALQRYHGNAGINAGPDDIYLAARGLRTMGVRMRQHEASTLAVAKWLSGHPLVARVLHPAFEDNPGHVFWKRDFKGASGLFSFILKQDARKQALAAFFDGLRFFGMGYSWGGFESLAIPFNAAKLRTATHWQPSGTAIRLHIGLETVEDLIADLDAGLGKLAAEL